MDRCSFPVRLLHSLHLAGSVLAHRVGATTRHPASGAVERRLALLVNVLVRRELLEIGCSAVTFGPWRALPVNLLMHAAASKTVANLTRK